MARAEAGGGQQPGAGPNLLVVPASLVGNWRQELARFAPSLRIFFAHRSECDQADLDRVAHDPNGTLAAFDVVVTTYGMVRRQEWLQQVRWSLVMLDEAQAIKNPSSAQARCVKKLAGTSRIVLTGTPVENHLGDLWSIFDFCCPGLLGTSGQFKQFVKRLNQRQEAEAFGGLRRLVRPYILRRLKTDPAIVPDLPEKTEMRVECGLSKKQAALYERAVDDLARRLKQADGMARRGLVLAVLMQLKQICNHPAQYLNGASFPPADSGKFERLRLLCEPIAERQEKALVFTQFQSLTQPLADFLATVFGRPGLVLHGGTPVRKRTELVRTFQDEQGPPFFVISLKAGGSGLNLTAASHVVHFDRWWNPAVENQATDRAFRIGQKRNVLVHKFVCRGTVEERIDAMIRDKQAVADSVLNQESEALLTEMSDDEVHAVCRSGPRPRDRQRVRARSRRCQLEFAAAAGNLMALQSISALCIRAGRRRRPWKDATAPSQNRKESSHGLVWRMETLCPGRQATGSGGPVCRGPRQKTGPSFGPGQNRRTEDLPIILGPGVVREPGRLQRFREPAAARGDVRSQRLGHRPGDRERHGEGDRQRLGNLSRDGQNQDAASGRPGSGSGRTAPSRSTR